MSDWVDLRSDTVTRPSPAMRDAMAGAEVGDDVYGEDPTVNRLQAVVAERLGFEAALFVPSGTMANQLAVLAHTERGDEVFIHQDSHVYYYEGGAAALWAGATLSLLTGAEGLVDPERLEQAIRPANIHHPRPRLLILENSHNRAGGAALAVERLRPVLAVARAHGLFIHVDGARLYNAAVALGVDVRALTAGADSVALCLSKGLGAPVGSLLAGSRALIDRARTYRKWLGGGMRQAGILAAAGLLALDNVARLADDHARAGRLQAELAARGFDAWRPSVPTNMVMVDLPGSAAAFAAQARNHGVLVGAMGPRRLRLVTHLDIHDDQVHRAIAVFDRLAGEAEHAG
ncbi:MAG: low-specificity L-threonine aldolase [Thermaerobacter sp.]|nr:low-specificity L-threonine aldolase [Thermaerobacter sp.]